MKTAGLSIVTHVWRTWLGLTAFASAAAVGEQAKLDAAIAVKLCVEHPEIAGRACFV